MLRVSGGAHTQRVWLCVTVDDCQPLGENLWLTGRDAGLWDYE